MECWPITSYDAACALRDDKDARAKLARGFACALALGIAQVAAFGQDAPPPTATPTPAAVSEVRRRPSFRSYTPPVAEGVATPEGGEGFQPPAMGEFLALQGQRDSLAARQDLERRVPDPDSYMDPLMVTIARMIREGRVRIEGGQVIYTDREETEALSADGDNVTSEGLVIPAGIFDSSAEPPESTSIPLVRLPGRGTRPRQAERPPELGALPGSQQGEELRPIITPPQLPGSADERDDDGPTNP